MVLRAITERFTKGSDMKLTQREKLTIIRSRLLDIIRNTESIVLDEETIELAIDLINTTSDKEFKKSIKEIS
jgi:hypothetical protein